MNEKQESLLQELLEEIKAEGIHFAATLLAKLAVHVQEETLKANPTCPAGYYWDTTSKSCVKDVG